MRCAREARKEEKCGGAASTSAKQAAKALLKKTAAKGEAVAMTPVSPAAAAPLLRFGREESIQSAIRRGLVGWALVLSRTAAHSLTVTARSDGCLIVL